jgi:REP element-mobilizing transposase RayT
MRKTIFAEGEFYHVYNRGVDKRVIFNTKEDSDRFQAYLYALNDVHAERATYFFAAKYRKDVYAHKRIEPLVAIGAYCLMPNHFHMLVTPLVEDGIPKFMHKVQTAYAMYFNEKTARTGTLFQGPYKSEHADSDTYLKYLYAYIHLNPAKLLTTDWRDASAEELRQLGSKILAYPYSSAGEYNLAKHVISNPKPFPRYFEKTKDMSSHLQFWLKYKNEFAEGK